MARLMSVTLTVDAVVARRKTETRRAGWLMLKPGDHLTLCRKVMGRKKDEPLDRLAEVRVVEVRRERLDAITDDAVVREGFTADDLREWLPLSWPVRHALAEAFVRFFTHHMGGQPDQVVTVIRWEYL